MKKVLAIVLVLLFVCAFLTACDKKDESTEEASTNAETASEVESAAEGGNDIVGTWASQDYNGAYIYTFNDNGTGNYDASGTQMPFTYTISDGKLSILYDGNTAPMELEYSVSGSVLNVKDSFGSDTLYDKK